MTIDPMLAIYWASLWFSLGVVFAEVTRWRPRKRKRLPKPPRRDRLRVHYLRGDDGLIFRVRCRPGAFRRMLAKIEDEECEGK